MNTFTTFRVIFEAALVAVALGPLACWLARKIGLVDIPNSEPHKQHSGAMPIAGGTILFISVIVVGLAEQSIEVVSIRPIMLAATITYLFGLWDDYKGLSPLVKLIGQVLAAILLIRLGVHVRLFTEDWLNWALTVFWVVGVTNAYNFVDSMDGLADGLAGLAFAFFMLATIDSHQHHLSLFSTILMGACLGSFYFNSPPARYFIGDSGSQFLGFVLAAIGIAYNPVGFSRFASWYVPIMLMGVPLFDATLVIFSRTLRGRPVYKAARDHTFHRLVSLGMSTNRAVLTMHGAAVFLGCLAFIALDLPPLLANTVFATVFLLGLGVLLALDNRRWWP